MDSTAAEDNTTANSTTNNSAATTTNATFSPSQTASDYIATQLRLEADAREALPYQFDTCTKPLGPLRQSVFACLTCTPPPATPLQHFTPAGVCYSCSISCHGEHELVELFTKRDFECDCGTTRMSNGGTACMLRVSGATGRKGDVVGEVARQGNVYNQNFQGKFCGCGEEYDPETEKGTMFQCLGLGTVEDGGCGEDWWHPECLMGLPRVKEEDELKGVEEEKKEGLETVKEEGDGEPSADTAAADEEPEDPPLPIGFPAEDAFDHLICYKCTSAFPWIKQYAGTPGFLPAVPADGCPPRPATTHNSTATKPQDPSTEDPKKRKASEDPASDAQAAKRSKPDSELPTTTSSEPAHTNGNASSEMPQPPPEAPKHTILPPPPIYPLTLFLHSSFRLYLCHCPSCYPNLKPHRQLLEEEETHEPPVSESDAGEAGILQPGETSSRNSLLSRGEAALNTMDRVRAIEGAMAYNHVRDKVKAFLAPFAESGQAVGAEDVKEYFARLRGDEAAQVGAGVGDGEGGGMGGGDGRREGEGH